MFHLEFQLVCKLQSLEGQSEELRAYRDELVRSMCAKVSALNRENFAVRQHLKYVELYSRPEGYQGITYADTLIEQDEIAPLILPDASPASVVRFDALMLGLELAYLSQETYGKARKDLLRHVRALSEMENIPAIQEKSELIHTVLYTDYLESAGIAELETIRRELRELMVYIHPKLVRYDTNFTDAILDMSVHESELDYGELENYKAKAEYYVRNHQDLSAIAKLKTNQPLTEEDIQSLEKVLWSEVGTREEYQQEYGDEPLGEFVRSIVGLDMNAAKEAFSEYLNDVNLDSRQIYFVNQIIEYIVHNGMMKDLSVLQEAPFTDHGSIVDIFPDLKVWTGIRKVIEKINANVA